MSSKSVILFLTILLIAYSIVGPANVVYAKDIE